MLSLVLLAAMVTIEQAGPPKPKDHKAEMAKGASGREEEPKSSLKRDMAPIVASQLLDLGTTENVFALGGGERNPLPGMQHSGGRLAWGAAEAALAAAMMKRYPKLKIPMQFALSAIHTALARGNQLIADEAQEVFGPGGCRPEIWGCRP